jgi:hypothetical protein
MQVDITAQENRKIFEYPQKLLQIACTDYASIIAII